jgi:hypothetical protein
MFAKKFLGGPFHGVLEGEVGSTGGKGSIMGGGDNQRGATSMSRSTTFIRTSLGMMKSVRFASLDNKNKFIN